MSFFSNWGINISSWGSHFDGVIPEDGRASVPPAGIGSIKIDWIGGEIRVERYGGSEIKLEQTSKHEISEDRMMVYSVSDGLLRIREGSGVRILSRYSTSLTVLIPEGVSFDSIAADCVSGDLYTSSLEAGDFTLESVSGSVNASSLTVSGEFKVESVSGALRLSGIGKAANIRLKTVSGSIRGEDIVGDTLRTDTVSGSVTLDGRFGSVTAKTVSGDTAIASAEMPGEIKMDTVSGDLTLALPENDGFEVSYSKVSGSFSCGFAVTSAKNKATYGRGGASISMKTVSGDLNIERLGG